MRAGLIVTEFLVPSRANLRVIPVEQYMGRILGMSLHSSVHAVGSPSTHKQTGVCSPLVTCCCREVVVVVVM